ncbi:hypothetical protein [Chitinophaga niabensis]|uniref:Uncharacterized protein n=1 Tax=Chitinophaga niabensis TaxID=536979 RepID=A0A1N6E0G4_9BACT|nr:hypothetical protein [Chitinophaga niabensis]SIN76474.1 hypothetical protein SAMN04488055_1213 [Chitinophaga niabensis]
MRVAVFFALLGFLLLRGANSLYIATHHHHVQSFHYAPGYNNKENFAEFSDAEQEQETEYFISEDVEDDEVSHLIARKYKLLARYNSALSDPSLSDGLSKYLKAPPPDLGHLSYKYITQRTLRI